MSYRWFRVAILGVLVARVTLPQVVGPDLQNYLSLTSDQVQSITDLNNQLMKYLNAQQSQYYSLQSQACIELAKTSPDAGSVGSDFAQMEMIRRDYNDQVTQVQGKIASGLQPSQAAVVGTLLDAARLQPLVSEAQCIHMEGNQTGFVFSSTGYVSFLLGVPSAVLTTSCSVPPVPTALTNYLNLSDAQIALIGNAILGNQDYLGRQALRITELQNDIRDLTAAQTIDSAALGADYVAISQIQNDETAQGNQLTTTVRGVLNDAQQPKLQALDNAAKLNPLINQAVSSNILVLPPNLQSRSGVIAAFITPASTIGGILSVPGGGCPQVVTPFGFANTAAQEITQRF